MITFNGTPLSVCTQEMADRIGGLVSWKDALQSSPQQWASWGYNDNPLLPGVFGDRPVEPGTLWWPTAAQEWAVGWFIVEATDAQNLEGSVGQVGTLELTWEEQETSGDELVYDSNHFPVTTVVDTIQAQMTLLSMRKLAIGVNPTESGGPTYLCTFVDQRFFWWAANTGALAADGATTTWLNLYTSLAGKLGITLNNDPVSSNYSIPASIVSLQYEPVPQWLDTIAQNVGQRVLCQLDGTVWAHSPLTVNTQLPTINPTADTVAGGTYYGSNLDLLPSSMDVVFPVFSTGVYQGTSYVINVPLGGTGGKATFKPGFVALGSGTPSNLTALTNYANQLAADLYKWDAQQLDVVFPGIQNVTISALHGNVLWTYQRDQLTTRVQYAPYEWREWPLSTGGSTTNITNNNQSLVFFEQNEVADYQVMPPIVQPARANSQFYGSCCIEVCVEGDLPRPLTLTGHSCADVCVIGQLGFRAPYVQINNAITFVGASGNQPDIIGYQMLDLTGVSSVINYIVGILNSANYPNGTEITFRNLGGAPIVFEHDQPIGTPANAFFFSWATGSGDDALILNHSESAVFKYSSVLSRWICISHTGNNIGCEINWGGTPQTLASNTTGFVNFDTALLDTGGGSGLPYSFFLTGFTSDFVTVPYDGWYDVTYSVNPQSPSPVVTSAIIQSYLVKNGASPPGDVNRYFTLTQTTFLGQTYSLHGRAYIQYAAGDTVQVAVVNNSSATINFGDGPYISFKYMQFATN